MIPLPKVVFDFCSLIAQQGGRPVIVGGYIRDYFLGSLKEGIDVDIEVFAMPYAQLYALCVPYLVSSFPHFGVIKTTFADVSLPRREYCIGKKYNQFRVELLPDLSFKEAAYRRDFTVNAIGWDFITHQFLDPYSGQEDVKNKLLRPISEHFKEDSYRILRAAQLIARYNFQPSQQLIAYGKEMDFSFLSQHHTEKTYEIIQNSPFQIEAKNFLKKIKKEGLDPSLLVLNK